MFSNMPMQLSEGLDAAMELSLPAGLPPLSDEQSRSREADEAALAKPDTPVVDGGELRNQKLSAVPEPPAVGEIDPAEAQEALAAAEALLAQTLSAKKGNVQAVGKALVAWERARKATGAADAEDQSPALAQEAAEVLRVWRGGLKAGDKLDVRSFKDGIWYPGRICKHDKEAGMLTIKFDQYSARHNETHAEGADNANLMPYKVPTVKPRQWKKDPEKIAEAKKKQTERLEGMREAQSHQFIYEEPQVIATTRSGRSVKSIRLSDLPAVASGEEGQEHNVPSPTERKRKRSEGAAPRKAKAPRPSKTAAPAVEEEEDDEPGEHAVDTGGDDLNEWACAECDQLERSEKDRLVLCDGPCRRSFHQSCLGLNRKEVDALESYLCDQCTEGAHACFACGDIGKDHVVGGVHKCHKPTCGKFYHQHCASQMRGTVVSKGQDEVPQQDGPEGEEQPFVFKFVCGRHVCDACGRGQYAVPMRGEMHECLKCPRSYHLRCLPMGSQHHEYTMICPEHDMDLPPLLGPRDQQDEAFECKRGEGWVTLILGSLTLPRAPPKTPEDPGNFRLPSRFFNEVYSKPPPYAHIPALRYVCKMPQKEPGPECQCRQQCGDTCLNRVLNVECVGGEPGAEGGAANREDRRYHNCNAGPKCGNRMFHNREYIKHELFRENGRGWGLRAMEDVKKGQLVFEYIGEVIDDQELESRLEAHQKDHPNDHNMYVMELESGYYLDARHKGNSSRFINHSCEPNCELRKWNVKGYTRIGIMAMTDIPAGTPLSYDYQFATMEEAKFKCYCDADTCRGTLAPKRLDGKDDGGHGKKKRLKKDDRKHLAELEKRREKREEAAREKAAKKDIAKRSLTSHLLPGDAVLGIRQGPPPRFFRIAKERRLFLVRNVRQGSNFYRRRELLMRRARLGVKGGVAKA